MLTTTMPPAMATGGAETLTTGDGTVLTDALGEPLTA